MRRVGVSRYSSSWEVSATHFRVIDSRSSSRASWDQQRQVKPQTLQLRLSQSPCNVQQSWVIRVTTSGGRSAAVVNGISAKWAGWKRTASKELPDGV